MKKSIQYLVIVMAIIVFASCKQDVPNRFLCNKKIDTIMFVHYKPILQNRIGCNGTIIPTRFVDGMPVGQKVKGWEMVSESIPVDVSDVSVNITADEKTSSNNSSFWNDFGKIFPWILALLVFGFILWLLSLLPWFGNRDRHVTHDHQHHHTHDQTVSDRAILSPAPPVDDRKFTIAGSGLSPETLFRAFGANNHNQGNGNQVVANLFGNGNITINVNSNPEKPQPPVVQP